MIHSISSILYDENKIQRMVSNLAARISKDYEDKDLVIICILKGSFVFLADLIRCFTIPVKLDFMALSSYGDDAVSSGKITVTKDIDIDITGKDILIVEDIVDSGLSLKFLYGYLGRKRPSSIKSCVLLEKQIERKPDIHIDYKGFEIGDDFIVGYGLDYAQQFRNLPYIGILKEELYK